MDIVRKFRFLINKDKLDQIQISLIQKTILDPDPTKTYGSATLCRLSDTFCGKITKVFSRTFFLETLSFTVKSINCFNFFLNDFLTEYFHH